MNWKAFALGLIPLLKPITGVVCCGLLAFVIGYTCLTNSTITMFENVPAIAIAEVLFIGWMVMAFVGDIIVGTRKLIDEAA
jgi:hypothetical protein